MGHPGIKHPLATVPFEDIEMMRTLYEEGLRICDIARKFEVKPDTCRQWIQMRTRTTC
jgi:uncharacterized protein YjcR